MKISLRDLRRVKTDSLSFTIKNWKRTLSIFEKSVVAVLLLFVILTSAGWAYASTQFKAVVPDIGGTFIEGVTGEAIDNIDLGPLTKAALVKTDSKGQVVSDLAIKWEINAEKTYYKFTLNPAISASDLASTLSKNPTYLNGAMPEIVDERTLGFKLDKPEADFLKLLTAPVFPYGPYKLDKKTKNEIRLKADKNYHLQLPYIQKLTVRVYPDQKSLEKAARKNDISASLDLQKLPNNWKENKLVSNKKHILFINSSKTYLKKTAVRDQLLKGGKPDSIKTLDVLEVNGAVQDAEYEKLKESWKNSGIDVKARQVDVREALQNDLPKRNYDVLYILTDEGISQNPSAFLSSDQRSGVGQNFAELANADIDALAKEFAATSDAGKKEESLKKINDLLAEERVLTEYKNIEEKYEVSSKVKGVVLPTASLSDSNRFDLVSSWYFFEKKVR